ncbi:MAG: hypothetical protein BGP23_12390 [Lysobacterales bacterium 66-474]|nr:MAG: hypothetical protein ABT18_04250 [Rhodanobacter sp. SCN 66-43]OJY86950.1 MAG: hypothetical protein BGP23_12390 [Xanthomonadales bacterium 66-474]
MPRRDDRRNDFPDTRSLHAPHVARRSAIRRAAKNTRRRWRMNDTPIDGTPARNEHLYCRVRNPALAGVPAIRPR